MNDDDGDDVDGNASDVDGCGEDEDDYHYGDKDD